MTKQEIEKLLKNELKVLNKKYSVEYTDRCGMSVNETTEVDYIGLWENIQESCNEQRTGIEISKEGYLYMRGVWDWYSVNDIKLVLKILKKLKEELKNETNA